MVFIVSIIMVFIVFMVILVFMVIMVFMVFMVFIMVRITFINPIFICAVLDRRSCPLLITLLGEELMTAFPCSPALALLANCHTKAAPSLYAKSHALLHAPALAH